jgi:hypothetical protein
MRSPAEIQLCIERANAYGEQQEKQGKQVDFGKLYATAIKSGWHQEYSVIKAKEALKKQKKAEIASQDAELAATEATTRKQRES